MPIHLPPDFAFSPEQAAQVCCCDVQTIYRAIKKAAGDPQARYGLKARRNTKTGPFVIYHADLKDFIERTYESYQTA